MDIDINVSTELGFFFFTKLGNFVMGHLKKSEYDILNA
jgi:hypothetical protein